jgi:hypothetical protein
MACPSEFSEKVSTSYRASSSSALLKLVLCVQEQPRMCIGEEAAGPKGHSTVQLFAHAPCPMAFHCVQLLTIIMSSISISNCP